MNVKVHWIIDGIAEIEADTLEQAEKLIETKLNQLTETNSDDMEFLGARAVQGKAYLPSSAEDTENSKSEE